MIIKLKDTYEYQKIKDYIEQDSARNYFIRLGFQKPEEIFLDIYYEVSENGEILGVLFKRRSGNLQFYSNGEFDVLGFLEIIKNIDFKVLISPMSYCDKFSGRGIFSKEREGAFIAELKDFSKVKYRKLSKVKIDVLKENDLDEVIEIYRECFSSFSPKKTIIEKLRTKRGRGLVIRNAGEIVSVAQTEFEERNSALIVGVATKKEFRARGFATECLKLLCNTLMVENKKIFLQYDNLEAGKIYKKLGFEIIDRVKFYYKN